MGPEPHKSESYRNPSFGTDGINKHAENYGVDTLPVIKPATSCDLISKTVRVLGGDACIRGTRIPVWLLVQMRDAGLDASETKSHFDQLITDADLIAAWDYYNSHKDEIDENIRRNEAE